MPETGREPEDIEAVRKSLSDCQAKLSRASEAEKAARDELNQFVYAASHDLQEPLRAISAYTQLLQRKYSTDPEAAEMTGFVLEGANRMHSLITSLLTYSRTSATPRRTTVNLSAIVQWALANLSAEIRSAGAEITYQDLPEANIDESQFVQLFQNLIGNALKFRGQAPPRIEISAEDNGTEHLISISDNGPGIPPKYHAQIFEVFRRLHGKDVPGNGIGLALCRRIVQAHGGRIWVESDGAAGSVFKFTIPH
jgi:light-regulated signal transduction histidine kinase (bacteriophytochrome)